MSPNWIHSHSLCCALISLPEFNPPPPGHTLGPWSLINLPRDALFTPPCPSTREAESSRGFRRTHAETPGVLTGWRARHLDDQQVGTRTTRPGPVALALWPRIGSKLRSHLAPARNAPVNQPKKEEQRARESAGGFGAERGAFRLGCCALGSKRRTPKPRPGVAGGAICRGGL